MKFCIVSPDLLGPVRNGGIGTACTNLAHSLASAGHGVELLFTQIGTETTQRDGWVQRYTSGGIKLHVAQEWINSRPASRCFPDHPPLTMSHHIYLWLRERHFDVIIFMEWQGNGFYSLHAKRAGLSFQKTAMIVQVHSPTLWHDLHNASLPRHHAQVMTYFMERKCIELADMAVSPSRYMLAWLQQAGYRLPRKRSVIPNLIDLPAGKAGTAANQPAEPINELVFFGRLEYRKGLVQFCDALDRLAQGHKLPLSVTFLGKLAYVADAHSAVYIGQRARSWPFPVRILSSYDQAQALAYLQEPARIAVMPSVMDNSPYTVYECLTQRIPFLARNTGGTAELIARRDQAACLFDDNPESLRALLAKVLGQPAFVPALAFAANRPHQLWTGKFVASCKQLAGQRKPIPKAALPFISVCLVHFNRPALLRQALDSLRVQDYQKFEVILADDGSTNAAALRYLDSLEDEFRRRKWRLLRLANGYLGRARNTASKVAKGDYLLFMDDDNVAMPDMLSRFAQAAASAGSDIVSTAFSVFETLRAPNSKTIPAETYLPLGNCSSYAPVANILGDANSLVRASTFRKLGGFTEDFGLGHEDHELHIKAALAGCSYSVVGSAAFWYRRTGSSMLSSTNQQANQARNMRPFIVAGHGAELGELALLAYMHNAAIPDPNAIQGNPESQLVLQQACSQLQANGMGYLAEQLVSDHKIGLAEAKQDPLARFASLTASTGELATLKASELRRQIRKFGKNNDELPPLLKKLLTTIVMQPTPNTGVVELIANLLRDDAEAVGLVARYHAMHNNPSKLHEYLEHLSALAEKQYLAQRPDVAQQVERGNFRDGRDHFERHGANEGLVWPFQSIIDELAATPRRDPGAN